MEKSFEGLDSWGLLTCSHFSLTGTIFYACVGVRNERCLEARDTEICFRWMGTLEVWVFGNIDV